MVYLRGYILISKLVIWVYIIYQMDQMVYIDPRIGIDIFGQFLFNIFD